MVEKVFYEIMMMKFKAKMEGFENRLNTLFTDEGVLDNEIRKQLKGLKYE